MKRRTRPLLETMLIAWVAVVVVALWNMAVPVGWPVRLGFVDVTLMLALYRHAAMLSMFGCWVGLLCEWDPPVAMAGGSALALGCIGSAVISTPAVLANTIVSGLLALILVCFVAAIAAERTAGVDRHQGAQP